MNIATFAAGCFWGIELKFSKIEGVTNTSVGYMGGDIEQPDYKTVCTGQTQHAEVVQVEFNPNIIDYSALLNAFWTMHDPTTLNRQGPDVGTQYRSAIFYHTPEQQHLAEQSKKDLNHSDLLTNPVVTEISPAQTYWPAEEYHQQYLLKRGMGSCGI